MSRPSKRTRDNLQSRPNEPLPPMEAVNAVKQFKAPKFDQTIGVVVHLGIDPKQADQALRGSIALPKGIGKSARVICFCQPDKVDPVKAAGAIEAGGEELVNKVKDGWFDFDVAVASPDMMRVVSPLGKVLGPKGLMPSPKAGTVTPDVESAVKEYSAGKQEYRNDDGGNIHCIIGKSSFSAEDLAENLTYFIDTIEKIRPASSKGTYMKKCVISGTMTPSVQVAV
ncbi:MAG: 50S ribosomal protein L1 [Phycisphaerae bacterium]|nr:50S ribosomal protein L1 [Phycisphaerae bacterium]